MLTQKNVIVLLTTLLVLIMIGCKHEIPKQVPEVPDVKDEPCDSSIVYFVNEVQPILNSSCAFAGCHDATTAQNGVILDTYDNIINSGKVDAQRPDNSDLFEVITETDLDKRMPPPPNAALTQDQIETIRTWILQGALNNQCFDCDSLNVTYSSQVVTILNENCVGCHNGSVSNGNVLLDTYSEVKTQVDSGKLIGVINHEPGFKPMPPSGTKISQCNLDIIDKWIANGAPNN